MIKPVFSTPQRIILGISYAVLLFILVESVRASGSKAEADATAITGDQVMNASTRAFSISGGDMDIDDCLSTWSIFWGLGQDVKTNPYCFAMQLDAIGKHHEAAQMRCSIRRVKKVYGANCIEAMTAAIPPPPPNTEIIETNDAEDNDDDDRYLAQQEELQYMQQQLDTFISHVEQVQQVQQRQVANPHQSPPPQRVGYTDAEREAVFAILAGKGKGDSGELGEN